MEPTNASKKVNLIKNVLGEFKNDNLLQPIIDIAKDALYPYFMTHLITQAFIILLLLVIIYIQLRYVIKK